MRYANVASLGNLGEAKSIFKTSSLKILALSEDPEFDSHSTPSNFPIFSIQWRKNFPDWQLFSDFSPKKLRGILVTSYKL